MLNVECPKNKACIRNKCKDPCPGVCGQNAICTVSEHIPICSCPPGTAGNAFIQCQAVQAVEELHPCRPSPCGPSSECREINGHAVCTCVPGYLGTPPSCRPECNVNSDCNLNEACSNQKCRNPCIGTCGVGALCDVINHYPNCKCPPRYTGDPFARCTPIPVIESPPQRPQNPCIPSPCGPNSQCIVKGESPACSCLIEFIGTPPNCRPECISNSECTPHLACINNKCKNPCIESCGELAECRVVSHAPRCNCPAGYTGDALIRCTPIQYLPPKPIYESPCDPSPCGPNTICKEQNGAGACTCISDYIGNPYEGCRPECVINTDCPSNKACINTKCRDPCPGSCGTNAVCQAINHVPSCNCIPGYTGNPFQYCTIEVKPEAPPQPSNPCQPSPCGANSQCKVLNGQAICSCLPTYLGSPPNCRPECITSAECPSDKSCIKQKCVDPCPGTCGQNANCVVKHHSPICSCRLGFTGDPFTRCYAIPQQLPPEPQPPRNPCVPSPCGPYSQCRDNNGVPSCSCLDTYTGVSPNCRPECTINSECPTNQACINQKCRDPCPGSCGTYAQCHVYNHIPTCTCEDGYTGDAFSSCRPIPKPVEHPTEVDPCNPSPCGANAQCRDGVCTCLAEYQGDPYRGCKPECVLNNECSNHLACIRNKCEDPCPGTCGQNAICNVYNHIPICSCPAGMSGNAFIHCRPFEGK